MAVIKLHNTLSGTKEDFKPLVENQVGIYSCGPTVYDQVHIGNLRAFVFPDVLRRMFEMNGYKVTAVRNITDVDDKTIKRSQADGMSLSELTTIYTALFQSDVEKLNIGAPTFSPKASENVGEMVAIIEKLLEKGLAYKASDGIYFSIAKSKNYGKLSGVNVSRDSQKERVANDEYDKENAQDFALWKFWTESDGDTFWDVSIGKGRPGWHIECSAMSVKYLGETFDIHTGGIDLLFPHHTNEIAQSEGANEKALAKYWLHNGHILVDGKKMSKSAKNFYTLADIEAKGVSPLAFRYWLLTAHYRTLVNFTVDALLASDQALKRLVAFFSTYPDEGEINETYLQRFLARVNDDLDTPGALALVWHLIKDTGVSDQDKKATLKKYDEVLGLRLQEQSTHVLTIPAEIKKLAKEREEARQKQDWKRSDELRQVILEAGFKIKDTDKGPQIEAL